MILRPEEATLVRLAGITRTLVTRHGDCPYDVTVEGTCVFPGVLDPLPVSVWLPLAGIHLIDWERPGIPNLALYATMVREGNWSSIRTTRPSHIWILFTRYVLPKLEQPWTFGKPS